MKLFEIILEEHIGEKEWTHHLLTKARTLSSAQKKAHNYARRFWASYDEPAHKNKDGSYEFNGGEIVVSIEDVREVSKEQWLEEVFQRALIGNYNK